MLKLLFITVSLSFQYSIVGSMTNYPAVITTWTFANATAKAMQILKDCGIALDAIEQGASVCEAQQCDGTVGYGGSPDENSETTLDALIMDGKTMNVGAVGALRRIKNAISVARAVLDHTKHSLLVGNLATEFAVQMGFKEESLTTTESKKIWSEWHNENNCQPNFWMDVKPDPQKHCGPYRDRMKMLIKDAYNYEVNMMVDRHNHDTIGMVAVDCQGDVAAGTSTNGARHKIPGRVGDSPIPGAGAYADNDVGGAAATGDGDIMMRFLPSFVAVEEMRRGESPMDAAETAMKRIAAHYPKFMGAIVTLTKTGQYGAACYGMPAFPFVLQDRVRESYEMLTVECLSPKHKV